MTVNGNPCAGAGLTVAALLTAQGFDRTRVAVERNGEIIPRAQFEQTLLTENDRLEVVQFVGGG